MQPRKKRYLLTGSIGDLHYWHHVEIDPIKFALLQKRIQSGSLNITEYGKIIRSGVGVNPPPAE